MNIFPARDGFLRRISAAAVMAGAIAAGALGGAAIGHADTAPSPSHVVSHAPDANPARAGVPGYARSPHAGHRRAHQHLG